MASALFAALLLALRASASLGLTVEVESGVPDCYFYEVQASSEVHLDYEVLQGGSGVSVQVTKGEGYPLEEVLSVESKVSDRVHWTAPDRGADEDVDGEGVQLYRVCFSVSGGLLVREKREISFSLHQNVHPGASHAKQEQTEELEAVVRQLAEKVDGVKDSMDSLAQRETRQQATNVTANGRVFYWSAVEVLAVLIVTCMQIVYMKKFFETKRRL
jgi:hypothetical protein